MRVARTTRATCTTVGTYNACCRSVWFWLSGAQSVRGCLGASACHTHRRGFACRAPSHAVDRVFGFYIVPPVVTRTVDLREVRGTLEARKGGGDEHAGAELELLDQAVRVARQSVKDRWKRTNSVSATVLAGWASCHARARTPLRACARRPSPSLTQRRNTDAYHQRWSSLACV